MSLLLLFRPRAAGGGGSTYTLSVDPGSFTVTGTNAALRFNRVAIAASGSYSVTGTAAALRADRTLTAAVGSFAVTGTAATFHVGLPVLAGSYTLTGTTASLRIGRTLIADSGSYSWSGPDTALIYSDAEVTVPPGSLLLIGYGM